MIQRAPRFLIAIACFAALAQPFLVACSRPSAESESEREQEEPSPPEKETPVKTTMPPARLEPGQRLKGALGLGESRIYLINATADHYLHVVVDQQGIDVVVSLMGPDGEPLLLMDRPIIDHGPEHIFAVTKETGIHHLRVTATNEPGPAGSYTVRFADHKRASETDHARANAAAAYSEARKSHRQGDYQQAATQFRQVLVAWEELGDASWQGESLVLLGLSHAMMGEWQTAKTCYLEAAKMLESAGAYDLQALAHRFLGLTHLRLMDLEPAIHNFREELTLRQKGESRRDEALAYHSLAQVFQVQDEVQQSLDYYAEALQLFERPADRAPSIHNRGVLFLSMGRLEQAHDALIEAEELSAALGDHRRQATTLNQLGELHRERDELETALSYFDQALALRRELKDRRGEANSLANVGRVHQARGESSRALAHYQQALKILNGLQQPWLAARVLLNLGSLHLDEGRSELALNIFRRSLDLYRSVGDPTGEAESLLGLARSERLNGQLAAARKASEQALSIFESVRPKAVSYDLRSSFFATVQRHLEFHIDLLMELHWLKQDSGYDALALRVSEQARARSLMDLLIESGTEIRRGADPVLLERERAVQGQLNAWEKRRSRLHQSAQQRPEQVREAEKTIRRLIVELDEIQTQIRVNHPRYNELKYGRALSADSIQNEVLDEETLLLEYWLGEKRSFLWALATDSLEVFDLPARDSLENRARDAHRLLTQSNRREARASTREVLCALSQQLIEPVADQLKGKRLLIVANGALQFIPFAALPEPGGGDRCFDSKPLVVAHEIVYLPSASALPIIRRGLERPGETARSVAVVADPVFTASDRRVRQLNPEAADTEKNDSRSAAGVDLSSFQRLHFSRQEADAILNLVEPSERLRAVGFDASKETVIRGQLAGYRFIHLATHGILNTTNPELSGIVLSLVDAEGRQQDGFLRAHEIYNLDLACELVVLSACQTALGKAVNGEGLIGLTRGFMYAGAARAMVSLWNVSDEGTAELMERFYGGLLRENQSPAAALRAAQVSMLGSSAKAAPYYWAGFVIQGDWR